MRCCQVMLGFAVVLLALVASGENAEPEDRSMTLGLSLAPTKDAYFLGEPVEFEIRVDNLTGREICVPLSLRCGQGYLLYSTTDPSGERVVYECEIVEEFQGDGRDMVCLVPGSFYGVRDRHPGLSAEGRWRFVATYYGPSSSEYPFLCSEKISSREVMIVVREE